jgi:hypothetical protein
MATSILIERHFCERPIRQLSGRPLIDRDPADAAEVAESVEFKEAIATLDPARISRAVWPFDSAAAALTFSVKNDEFFRVNGRFVFAEQNSNDGDYLGPML